MSTSPAKIVKLDRGTLRMGAVADVTVIDPKQKWKIDVERFVSKSRNCPFQGWEVEGRAIATIVGGDVKWEASRSA
jgi:dihydroorotase